MFTEGNRDDNSIEVLFLWDGNIEDFGFAPFEEENMALGRRQFDFFAIKNRDLEQTNRTSALKDEIKFGDIGQFIKFAGIGFGGLETTRHHKHILTMSHSFLHI